MFKKIIYLLAGIMACLVLLGVGLSAIAVLYTYPKLPPLDAVTRYSPKIPLKIYSADGRLIGIYGEERRHFTRIEDFPEVMKNAVIAAEDKRFYQHWGVDVIGVVRALISNITSGRIESGASTITQQVAKNFFLTNERSYRRKFNEMLMAYKIERSLTKDQILELYFNQIYLGQRSYGFAAASMAYFNKPVQEVTLAEAAILAGLPKAPSAFNPVINPERAKVRQLYILDRMLAEGMIDQAAYEDAKNQQMHYDLTAARNVVDENALYVAEMVRQKMYEKYGDEAYSRGFHVYTTVSSERQKVATAALRRTLVDYDKSQRFVGAENYIDIARIPAEDKDQRLARYLHNFYRVDDMVPALVLYADQERVVLMIQDVVEPVELKGAAIRWIQKAINNDKMGKRQVQAGALLRVRQDAKKGWLLTQKPELQGAVVSVDVATGAILALVGGFDFYEKEFNRAIQAWRQPGSTFKPFIYSAGLSRGLTASTLINDDPLSFPGLGPNKTVWEPKNSDNRYLGMMTLHQGLVSSRNMVSIRILMATGLDYTHQYIQRFGFDGAKHPKSLSLALGTGVVTPLQMAQAYAVFANGGYQVPPYLIDRIYDDNGRLLARTEPIVAKKDAPQVIDPRNAFIMYNIMQDVTRYGTAARAAALKRNDIAGKTGTTNEQKDAWFVGFNPKIVTAVYIGYDQPRSMGRAGFGGRIALPVWMDYMSYALKGMPNQLMPRPANVVERNGEYYYREWQQTNPELELDNGEIDDEELFWQLIGAEELQPLNTPVLPDTPTIPSTVTPEPSRAVDSLF